MLHIKSWSDSEAIIEDLETGKQYKIEAVDEPLDISLIEDIVNYGGK